MGDFAFGNSWCCCLKDGTTVDVAIGDKESDPVFVISDLLIHLSADQLSEKGK